MVREIKWPRSVQLQLEKAYQYIVENSFQNAEKVKADILSSIRMMASNPEIHPPDKFRKNNDGSFRAFEIHHYRVAYRVTEEAIIIVRIRHTGKEPKLY